MPIEIGDSTATVRSKINTVLTDAGLNPADNVDTTAATELLNEAATLWEVDVEFVDRMPEADFRADFTALESAHVTVPHKTNFDANGYNAYAYAFNLEPEGGEGVTWSVDWSILPAFFPERTRLHFEMDDGLPTAGGVAGYYQINLLPVGLAPIQIGNISSFTQRFKYTVEGDFHANVLSEHWTFYNLAKTGFNPTSTVSEHALWLNAPASEWTWRRTGTGVKVGGTLTVDSIPFDLWKKGEYMIFGPVGEVAVQEIDWDWKASYDFVIFNGELTGFEWFTKGPQVGVEPIRRTGSGRAVTDFYYDELDIQIAGTQTLRTLGTLGTNLLGSTWEHVGMTPTTGQADVWGGTGAVRLLETATTGLHSRFIGGANDQWPSRELDVWIAAVVSPIGGRVNYELEIASDPGFANRVRPQWNTSTDAVSLGTPNGTGFTVLKQEVITLQSGVHMLLVRLRKAAGITGVFLNLQAGDGTSFSYLGDVAKGFTLHGIWSSAHRAISLSGTPTATADAPMSFTPTVKGGQGTLTFASADLPAGTSINSATGEVSGTVADPGTYNFTITVTGANGSSGSQPFSLAVEAVPLTTWDPANKDANIALSLANRRATSTAGTTNKNVKSTTSWGANTSIYVEYKTASASANQAIGFGNASSLTSDWVGSSANSAGVSLVDGNVRFNGTSSQGSAGIGSVFPSGSVIGLALRQSADGTIRKVWFSLNGVWGAGQDPATNTGGFVIPNAAGGALKMMAGLYSSTAAGTIATEAYQFEYSPPSGFSPGN